MSNGVRQYVAMARVFLLLCVAACSCDSEMDNPTPGDGGSDGSDSTTADAPAPDDSDVEPDATPITTCEQACMAVADAELECGFPPMGKRVLRAYAYRFEQWNEPLERALAGVTHHVNRRLKVVLIHADTNRITRLRPLLGEALPVHQTPAGHPAVAHGRVVVHGPRLSEITQIVENLGGKVLRPVHGLDKTFLLETQADRTVDFAKELAEHPHIVYAEPSWLRHYARRGPINDPLTTHQWFLVGGNERVSPLADISAEPAWEISEGAAESVVAIFDDGVDLNHPDLQASLVEGLYTPDDIDAEIENGCCQHGTAVAGVAAARANDIGLRGVCPTCSIFPIFDTGIALEDDAATAETFTDACVTAAAINNSWGPPDGVAEVVGEELPPAMPLASVVNAAFEACETNGRGGLGTVIVFAAGNGNEDASTDPLASHPLTLNVAALAPDGRKASYSDFGSTIDVTAPSNGLDASLSIWTTFVRAQGDAPSEPDYTSMFGGTSSSAPVVAGLAGLIVAVNPSLTAAEVRDLIRDTAVVVDPARGNYDSNGRSPYYGFGLVNAFRALRAAEARASQCTPVGDEVCNGVDDDCDSMVDEDCPVLTACAPCGDHGECGPDNLCANLPNDTGAFCLAPCGAADVCPTEHSCESGFCVPDSGRCSAASDEVCNGIDDNLDGVVDESGCQPSMTGECISDAQCPSGVCAGGFCDSPCEDEEDCEGAECLAAATRYGEASDARRLCAQGEIPTLELCTLDFCLGGLPVEARDALIMCVREAAECPAIYDCPFSVFEDLGL